MDHLPTVISFFLFKAIQTQLYLRGTEHEHLDAKLDSILQEIRKSTLNRKDVSLEEHVKDLESTVGNLVESQRVLKNQCDVLAEKVARLDNTEADTQAQTEFGIVYTRWGRTVCPGNGSHVVYSGYAAGGHYTHAGASPNILCLPRDPVWGKYDDSLNSVGGYIYGVEYEQDNGRDQSIFGKSLHQQDAPCVVCEVKQRTRQLMISGRTTCYDGWTREYWGYLMTGHYKHTAQEDYHCIDEDPESLPGGHVNHNGYLLYFVEVRCDALKCPPYVKGRELACVVCTK